jgi:Lon protease-like protein
MCLFSDENVIKGQSVSRVGTLVKVVDFEQLADGFLGITVEGKQRFRIQQCWVEHDGLRKAEVELLDNWQARQLEGEYACLGSQLRRVYRQFPQLEALYPEHFFNDISWVTQRWLELLPLDVTLYEALICHKDCLPATHVIAQVIGNSLSKRR